MCIRWPMRKYDLLKPAQLWLVLSMLTLLLTGCTIGYISINPQFEKLQPPPGELPDISIVYNIKNDDLRMVLERTLRSNMTIHDLQYAAGITSGEPDRFILEASVSNYNMSIIGETWLLISFFSFSALPAMVDDNRTVQFLITAPDGDKKTFDYHYTERIYSWLPFIFFGPGMITSVNGGEDRYDPDRIKIKQTIMNQFMVDVTPFIISHAPTNKAKKHD